MLRYSFYKQDRFQAKPGYLQVHDASSFTTKDIIEFFTTTLEALMINLHFDTLILSAGNLGIYPATSRSGVFFLDFLLELKPCISRPRSDLISIFRTLPAAVTTVKIESSDYSKYRWTTLRDYTFIDELINIVSALPPTVTCLNLSGYNFTRFSTHEIVKIFRAIPSSITNLDLAEARLRNFEQKHVDDHITSKAIARPLNDMIKIIGAIPTHVTAISFYWFSLNSDSCWTAKELVQILTALHRRVTSLDLSINDLDTFSTDEFIQILKAIPADVTTLKLHRAGLGKKSNVNIIKILQAIPTRITHLELNENFYFAGLEKSAEDLTEILKNIPSNVTTISFTSRDFRDDSELALASLPQHIDTLTLSLDDIYHSLDLFIKAWTAIPPHVTVNFSRMLFWETFLRKYTNEELDPIFMELPIHLKMDGFNLFQQLSLEMRSSFDRLDDRLSWPSSYKKANRLLWPFLYYEYINQKESSTLFAQSEDVFIESKITLKDVLKSVIAAEEVNAFLRLCHPNPGDAPLTITNLLDDPELYGPYQELTHGSTSQNSFASATVFATTTTPEDTPANAGCGAPTHEAEP